jgi:hypothetical protein
MRSLRLAQPAGPGAGQAGRCHHHERPFSGQYLELPALGDAGLVDVAREDELRARFRELLQDAAAAGERALARPPRRVRELMVEADDAERSRRRFAE